MTVTIAVAGKFQPAYHLARHLERSDQLERLITPIPYERAGGLGVSRANTTCLTPFAYWTFGFERYGPRALRSLSHLGNSMAFGWIAARLMGEPRAFIGWCGSALEGIRRAHTLGVPSVLQSGSTHIGWQTDVLRGEFRRFGYDGPLTHPAMVSRCLTELDEADAIVVPSRFALRTFAERGIPESKLFLVPWGVTSLVSAPAERRSTVPRILFVGALSVRKGIPYLLEAFRRIDRPGRLRLVGPIDRPLLRLLGGLPPGADAVGPKRGHALANEYRDADVFVMPSVEDGSAMAVLEAMNAGLPAVVSDQAGADQVEDGVGGFVVPARDAGALAERLDVLLSDATLRRRMGAAAATAVADQAPEDFGRLVEERVLAPLAVVGPTPRWSL